MDLLHLQEKNFLFNELFVERFEKNDKISQGPNKMLNKVGPSKGCG